MNILYVGYYETKLENNNAQRQQNLRTTGLQQEV